jgi:hypothetical protein
MRRRLRSQPLPAKKKAQKEGCTGLTVLVKYLPYVSYQTDLPRNVWLFTVCHALLFGVVASFFNYILRPLAKSGDASPDQVDRAGRQLIEGRAGHIRVTSEFGRNYKCLVRYRGSYRMEDWLHFVETFAEYILADALPPVVQEMWEELRYAVVHYCRVGDPAVCITDAERKTVAGKLRRYAKLMEEHAFPNGMITCNLQQSVCRLPAQEVARGQVGKDAQWWVERLMHMYKRQLGKRVSRCPDKTFAKLLLLVQRLDKLRLEDPSVKGFDEWVPEYRAAQLEPPCVDDGDEASDTVLMGKGVPVGRKSKTAVLQLLKAYLRDMPVAG